MSDKKWLRDWGNFDWSEIMENLDEYEAGVREDLGISREELKNFLRWLSIHNGKLYEQVFFTQFFKEMGFDNEEAMFLAEHIDELIPFLENSPE